MTRTPRITPSAQSVHRTSLRRRRRTNRWHACSAGPRSSVPCAGMDVRIGVTQAPRELTLELPDDERDDAEKQIEAALSGAVDVLWLTDKRGRGSASRRRRSPTSSSARTTATAASASAADRRAAAPRSRRRPARPPPAVRHRQGWRRQDVGRRGARPLAARSGKRTLVCEMDAKGALAADVRHAPLGSSPARSTADLFAHGDEHRGLAARVPAAVRQGAARRAHRPARPHVRLRRRRRARASRRSSPSASSPTRSASATTTSSSSTPRRAATSSPRSARRG